MYNIHVSISARVEEEAAQDRNQHVLAFPYFFQLIMALL